MRWEEMLLDLFEDLEQQAEGLALADRDVELTELSRAEYAHVGLAARWHASLGRTVTLDVQGIGPLRGDLARAGRDWCLLSVPDRAADLPPRPGREWIVRAAAVLRWRGLSERGLDEAQRSLSARLGIGSALRGVAASRSALVVHLVDGAVLRGRLGRVGSDFAELLTGEPGDVRGVFGPSGDAGAADLVPFTAVAAVRR
jgi:hypothetical protein